MQVHQFGQRCGRAASSLITGWLLLFVVWFGLAAPVWAQAEAKGSKFAPSRQSQDDSVINLETNVVSLTVTVTDKQGRYLPNLQPGAFTVYEEQVAQELSFFNQADVPATIAIVFDLSGSMRKEKIQRARVALERFLLNCHPEDEYSLVGFNDQAWVAVDHTRDSQQLLRQFQAAEPAGHTALYDAVALGLEQLERGQHARRVLLIISDGEDNRSRASFRQIKRLSQESAALVYAIGVTDFALRNGNGRYLLQDLTEESGGKAFFPRGAEAMSEAFENIALELRQQYSLGYTPSNFVADGKWRKLKIKVAPPVSSNGIAVRARTGYYAQGARAGRESLRAEN
jgi:Ca-activated chloride channel family protein